MVADIVNMKYDAEAYVPIWESQVSQQLYDMENDWVRHCPFSLAHACLSKSLN